MQAPTPPSAPHSAPPASSTLTLTGRLKRLAVYFGDQRLAWSLAIIATLVGALTEPLLPALLKPLLDQGWDRIFFISSFTAASRSVPVRLGR